MLPHLIFLSPLAILAFMAWRQLPRARLARIMREEVERHRVTLRGKWLRAHDEYGAFDREEWEDECAYFLDRVILPRIRREPSERKHARLVKRVSRLALSRIEEADEALEAALSDDPVAFEHRSADILRAAGWEAHVSGAAGDQGADVVATAGARTLIVQCKRYTKPIGNKAVQEANAARAYYRADMAAVVGTAPFTKSARDLADATDVMLLDEAGLAALEPPR